MPEKKYPKYRGFLFPSELLIAERAYRKNPNAGSRKQVREALIEKRYGIPSQRTLELTRMTHYKTPSQESEEKKKKVKNYVNLPVLPEIQKTSPFSIPIVGRKIYIDKKY